MTWSAVILRDGVAVVQAPVDDWFAAQVLAEVSVALWGGPVSVSGAVVAQRVADAPGPEPTLFDVEPESAGAA